MMMLKEEREREKETERQQERRGERSHGREVEKRGGKELEGERKRKGELRMKRKKKLAQQALEPELSTQSEERKREVEGEKRTLNFCVSPSPSLFLAFSSTHNKHT